MTICASVPYAGAMSVSGVNGEVRMRKESGRLPRQRAMTDSAFGIESGRNVVWVPCINIFALVASYAFGRCTPIPVSDVAAQASDGLMCPPSRELCQVMIET